MTPVDAAGTGAHAPHADRAAAGTIPDVSVIICVRNGERTIERQLAALDAQRGSVPFEVLIVDNGSTDATARIVTTWLDRAGHAHCAARLIDGGAEPGIPRARNLGASLARGRIIAFCDADDEVLPGWVQAWAEAIDGHQLAGGLILPRNEAGERLPGVFGDGLARARYLPHVGNCNCAIAREAFFAVGGYDESLPPYGFEDVDLSWRVQEAGYPLIYVPEARVHFTVSGNRASIRKRFLLGKGRVLMAARFPRYDATRYTVRSTVSDMAAEVRRLLGAGIGDRAAAKRAASSLVAGAGRFVAACEYRRSGLPERRLLHSECTARSATARPCVAIAANNGDMGGGEVMLLNIADALRELGFAVTVIGPAVPGEVVTEAGRRRFHTVALKASGRAAYMAALAMWRLAHRDVPLWCNGLVPSLATAGIGPRIVHLHRVPTGLQRHAVPIARLGARRTLVPSEFVAQQIRGSTVLPNWTDEFSCGERRSKSGPVRIGFLGRLTAEKGADLLARAVSNLPEDIDVRLVVAGETRFGTAEDEMQVDAALESVADRTERLGWVAPEDLFSQIDVLVCPSRAAETFGLAAAEAMAAGIPVIVSDAGALPEVVGDQNPWIAPADDSRALSDALTHAVRQLRDGADLGAHRARARWEQNYSPLAGRRRVAAMLGSLTADDEEGRRD